MDVISFELVCCEFVGPELFALGVVEMLDFWEGPFWGEASQLVVWDGRFYGDADAEVSEFHFLITHDQQILRLHILVYNTLLMQIIQPLDALEEIVEEFLDGETL